MANKKDCEGCATYNKDKGCIWFDDGLICPCSIYLIKVMCLNKCELLDNHIHLIKEASVEKGIKGLL